MTGPPPINTAPVEAPIAATDTLPLPPPEPMSSFLAQPLKAASVKVGSEAIAPEAEPLREPMLPARPHTGEDDV